MVTLNVASKTPNFEVPWDESTGFEVTSAQLLGQGSFGRVFKAHHRLDHVPYAIKEVDSVKSLQSFRKRESDVQQLLPKLEREVEHHKNVRSSFVVKFYSYWVENQDKRHSTKDIFADLSKLEIKKVRGPYSSSEEDEESEEGNEASSSDSHQLSGGFIYIQLEFCNNRTLQDMLDTGFVTDPTAFPQEASRIIYQTAKGLHAIHSLDIIHRDLKPDNIYCQKLHGREELIWKIGDFGLSIRTGIKSGLGLDSSEDKVECSETDVPKSFAGTWTFRSPEMLLKKPYNSKTDIYALGLIYICVLARLSNNQLNLISENGLWNPESLKRFWERYCAPKILRGMDKYFAIVKRMLSLEPKDRPDAETIFRETLRPLHFHQNLGATSSCKHFVGRDSELELLERNVLNEKNLLTLVLDGKSCQYEPVGKTALVRKFIQTRLKDWSVLWLNCWDENVFDSELFNLCEELDVSTRKDGAVQYIRERMDIIEQLSTAVKSWFEKCVVVFDSVIPHDELNFTAIVKSFLEKGIQCIVISSETNRSMLDDIGFPHTAIKLANIPGEDAQHYLRLELSDLSENEESLNSLNTLLRGSAFCLSNAVTLIKEREKASSVSGFGVKLFIKRFQTERNNLLIRTRRIGEQKEIGQLNVLTIVSLNVKHVLRYHDEMNICSDILCLLYFVQPAELRIRTDLLGKLFQEALKSEAENADASYLDTYFEILTKYGLIMKVHDNRGIYYKLTDATDSVYRPRAAEESLRKILATLQALKPFKYQSHVKIAFLVFRNAMKYPTLVDEFSEFLLELLYTSRENVERPDSRLLYEYNRNFRKVFGEEDLKTLQIRNFYLTSIVEDGEYKTGLECYKKLQKVCRKKLPQNHWLSIDVSQHIANLYETFGHYSQAKEAFVEILKNDKDISDKRVLTRIKGNYALLLAKMYEMEAARKLQEEILSFSIENFGPEDHETLTAMHNLASTLHKEGNTGEALEKFKEVLQLSTRLYGEEHEYTLMRKVWIAGIMLEMSEDEEQAQNALALMLHAHSCLVPRFGPFHPTTLPVTKSLAEAYQKAANLEKSKELYESLYTHYRANFGESYPDTFLCRNELADFEEEDERRLEIYKEILPQAIAAYGEEHPTSLNILNSIGIEHYNLKDWEEAKDVFRKVLELRIKVLGLEHTETLAAKFSLGDTLQEMGEYEEALRVLEEIAMIDAEELSGEGERCDVIENAKELIEEIEKKRNEV